MLRLLLLALLAGLPACASVASPGDGVADNGATPDAALDRDTPDTTLLDRPISDDRSEDVAEVRDTRDQLTDVVVTDPECNDLFPFTPITATEHDAPPPALESFRGGMIPDGTYRLIRRDTYFGAPPTVRYLGRTLVVRGRVVQSVFLGANSPDFSTAQARRATCASEVPLGMGRPLCVNSCPDKARGVPGLGYAHEMRGTQLVLSELHFVLTYDRVGP